MKTGDELLDGKPSALIGPIYTSRIGRRVLWEALVIDVVDIQPDSAISHLVRSVTLKADLCIDRVFRLRGHRRRSGVDARFRKERDGRDLVALNAQQRH